MKEMLVCQEHGDVRLRTFIFEIEKCRELPTFVVTPQQKEARGIRELEGKQIKHTFRRKGAAVYIVSHEQILGRLHWSPDLEQSQQIKELAVYVAAHGDGIG